MSLKNKTFKLRSRKSRNSVKNTKTTRERKPKRHLKKHSRKGKRKMTRRGGQFTTPPRNENSNVNPPPIERNSDRNTERTLPLPSNLLSRFEQMHKENEEDYTDEEDMSGGKKKRGGQPNKRKDDLEELGEQFKRIRMDINEIDTNEMEIGENNEDVDDTMAETNDITNGAADENEPYIKMTNDDADRIVGRERQLQQILFNGNIDDAQYEQRKQILLNLLFPKNTDFTKMSSVSDAYRVSTEGNKLFE